MIAFGAVVVSSTVQPAPHVPFAFGGFVRSLPTATAPRAPAGSATNASSAIAVGPDRRFKAARDFQPPCSHVNHGSGGHRKFARRAALQP